MNKKFWSLILLLCMSMSVSLPVMAAETEDEELGFWVEAQMVSDGVKKATLWYERELTESFGLYALVYAESGEYWTAYAGPTWRPTSWLQVGVGIGRETMPDEIHGVRRNFFLDANWEKVNLFWTFENGNSGPWHKVTATYAISEKFGAGVMDETGLGHGPRLEYNIKKNVQVWGAVLHDKDTGDNTSIIAINFTF